MNTKADGHTDIFYKDLHSFILSKLDFSLALISYSRANARVN
jgi:hypothetical protein